MAFIPSYKKHGTNLVLVPLAILFIYSFWSVEYEKKDTHDKMPYQSLKIDYKSIDNPDEIVAIKDSLVKPLLYQKAVSLKGLPVEQKKKRFIDLMLPAILVAKFRVEQKRKRVGMLIQKETLSPNDSLYLEEQLTTYKAKDTQSLRKKLHTHPPSIILAQAALECGWGTSRFFVEGNNVFGIWSYDSSEPRIKAAFSRGNKDVYVRKYDNLALSIEDYFKTIARVSAYQTFVQKRVETSDPFKLIPYLKNYSELREIYVKRLGNMIRLNNFTQYDHYKIDSSYIQPVMKKVS